MDESSSNSKNFRPWEVESKTVPESRVPELGLHNNPFALGALGPPLLPSLFHGILPNLPFNASPPSFGHQLALHNFLHQSQNYMNHQKALAALRLKSEFEQFSSARKPGQCQEAWQSIVPGSQVASGFHQHQSKTATQREPPRTSVPKISKDGDNEESKAAKTKKEPGVKPYKCPICDAQFNRPANLKTHLRIHSGEKPYKCDTCSARFVQVAHLRAHMLIHTGEKPYPCQICGTRFRHLQTLKSHIRIHTGEKPFSCDECSLRFRHKSQLRLHLRTKHGINTNTKKSYTYVPGLINSDLSKIVKETKCEPTSCGSH